MSVRYKMRGAEEMKANIRKIATSFPKRVGAALYQEANIEMTEAKRRVPFEHGILKASGFVAHPEYKGSNISVTL